MIPEPGFQNPMLYFGGDCVSDDAQKIHKMDSHLGGGGTQKVINLLINVNGALKIGNTANLGLNQVVTVNGSGDGSAIHSSGHEL